MNYRKLKTSFLCLLLMSIIQAFVAFFIIHHTLITILSLVAILLTLLGLIYTIKKE